MAPKMHVSPIQQPFQHKLTPYSLLIGGVHGRISEVFEKVSSLNVKHSFSFAVIAGNLFAAPDRAGDIENEQVTKLLKGEIEVPVPTYFALGDRPFPAAVVEKITSDGGELCPNLSVLGRKVSIKTADGFRIVAIGGQHAESSDVAMDEYAPVYTDKDVESAKDFKEADILITSDWPAGIRDGSSAKYPGHTLSGVHSLGELVAALKPRYHFSTSAAFFEREPFFHNGPAPRPVTRFLSFSSFGHPSKQKWLYAFQLEPSAPPPDPLPTDATASPFTLAKKRKLDSQEDSFNNFRYSNGGGSQQYNTERRFHKRPRGQRNQHNQNEPRACYFCLSNQSAESHMVASIGEEAYLTIAKGPLSTHKTYPGLGLPYHMLIIPMQHAPTIKAIDEGSRGPTYTEMQRYRTALHNLISAKSTKGEDGEAKLGAVTWEISRGGGVHLHWQFLPVPVDMIKKGLVEAAFIVEAENRKYPKFLTKLSDIEAAEDGHYFKAMIWSEAIQKEILLPLDEEFNFDLQFARKVMGKLLGLEDRFHWQDVKQSMEEETKDANAFREAFKEFEYN